MDTVEIFGQIRVEILKEIRDALPVFFCDAWDPMCEFTVTRDVSKLISETTAEKFCDFPEEYFPRYKFRRSYNDNSHMEIMVQEYFCNVRGLNYLGTVFLGNELFDVYLRPSYFLGDFSLLVKFGHGDNDFITGNAQAEHEHEMGMQTPLAVAYQFALDEGAI